MRGPFSWESRSQNWLEQFHYGIDRFSKILCATWLLQSCGIWTVLDRRWEKYPKFEEIHFSERVLSTVQIYLWIIFYFFNMNAKNRSSMLDSTLEYCLRFVPTTYDPNLPEVIVNRTRVIIFHWRILRNFFFWKQFISAQTIRRHRGWFKSAPLNRQLGAKFILSRIFIWWEKFGTCFSNVCVFSGCCFLSN